MRAWWRHWREGPQAAAILRRMGIDARQYWLLVDLLEELADRRDLYSQAGLSGVGWRMAALFYLVIFGLLAVVFAMGEPATMSYLLVFLGLTVVVLATTLLPETGSTLVNPTEGLVLAHLPVRGATYTAAKLTHLLKMLWYFVPAINGVAALMGWRTKQATWGYPAVHLASAFAAGLAVALGCCAAYGWLLRLMPPARLRTAGQTLELAPWLLMAGMQAAAPRIKPAMAGWYMPGPVFWGAAGVLGCAFLLFGLRALSLDYLARVTSIAHGRERRPGIRRAGWIARWAGRGGGPWARAGYHYLAAMAWRDAAFRRQALASLAPLLINAAAVIRGLNVNPFGGRFSAIHFFPHVLGVTGLLLSSFLAGGSYPKAVWIFQFVPGERLTGFANGAAWAFAWRLVAVPHLLVLAPLVWKWGMADAALFTCFSATMTWAYLAAVLRLVEGIPFGKKLDRDQGSTLLPVLIVAGLVMGVVVTAQHFLLFGSRLAVAVSTLVLGAGAWWGMRGAARSWGEEMRLQLSALAEESGTLYHPVD